MKNLFLNIEMFICNIFCLLLSLPFIRKIFTKDMETSKIYKESAKLMADECISNLGLVTKKQIKDNIDNILD